MMAQPRATQAWRLADLLAAFVEGSAEVDAGADLVVREIALDSRRVAAGTLFLACPGNAAHGMAFAEHARDRGALAIAAEPTLEWDSPALSAAAVRLGLPVIPIPGLSGLASALADRFYGEPSAHLEVIGVTGANGKTSVTYLLAHTLAEQTRCAVLGTISSLSPPASREDSPSLNVGVGFPGGLTPDTQTAQDAVTLQDSLARLRARGVEAVAMALSSDALAQGRAAAVRFTHAVSTSLTGDHLDHRADMTAGGAAEGLLFRSPGLGWAVLNADDPASARIIADLAPGVRVALVGLGPQPPAGTHPDLWVGLNDLTPLRRGLRLHVLTDGPTGSAAGEGEVEVGVLGTFNAANLLAVLAVLLARGLALEPALHALAKAQGAPGHMECFGGEDAPLVAVDSAHTPDSLQQAIAGLRRHGGGRLITVFGCAGERDRSSRPLMGAAAEAGSDLVIVTDDNPRGEDGDAIIAEILSGMTHPHRVRIERQRGLAIRIALTLAGTGDSVLIAGKGHETIQDLGDIKVHFSDRAQVVQALWEWTGGRR
jgi:UDP-N-acetylmuramoyl-L-alanyl-D-glutamate--2,6-diaminopimelate ligase